MKSVASPFHTSAVTGWQKSADCTGGTGVGGGITETGSLGTEAGTNCFFGSDFFGVTGIHSFSVEDKNLYGTEIE